jgi:hypothetical protein
VSHAPVMARRWSPGSRRWVLLTALGCVAAGSAFAYDVRGTLTGADALSPSARPTPPRWRGSFWEAPNGALAISAPRVNVERDVGVVLTGAGVPESRQPVTLPVEGGQCRPGTVVLTPGTTLTLDNRDLLGHEFYVVRQGQEERVVPAELTAARTRRQVSLPAAGTYEVRDVRQPTFRCWVIAGPGQGRVLPVDRAGAFTASLDDGPYTVKAYFEGVERGSAEVTVAGREATVSLPLGANGAGAGAPPAAPEAPADNHHRRRDH